MENIPFGVAACNALDDERHLQLQQSAMPDFSTLHYVPTEGEVFLDRWLDSHLRKPEEQVLIPAHQLPRYVPGTDIPLASYTPVSFCAETVTLQIGTQDVIVKHTLSGGSIPNHGGGGKRGVISKLSRQSIKRMKLTARNVPEGSFQAFLTLTYPHDFPTDGLKVKRDLATFRKWCKRRSIGAFWFLEFQERGAPHFHLFLSNYPMGGVKAVAEAWYRIVGSDDPKHLDWHLGKLSGRPCLEYMRKPHAASFYATKYAAKQVQKEVPDAYKNVGRFWGRFGSIKAAWSVVTGRGNHCGERTKHLVNHFRCAFDERAMNAHWVHKLFVSTVMWGGAVELSDMMAFVRWTPF